MRKQPKTMNDIQTRCSDCQYQLQQHSHCFELLTPEKPNSECNGLEPLQDQTNRSSASRYQLRS